MKTIIAKGFLVLLISPLLFSFSRGFGGEGFEIYLNDKIFTQQFGGGMDDVKSLQLGSAASGDKLVIKYHHCGRVGKNRVVTIKDGQNNIVREYKYTDVTSPVSAMSVPLKDIAGLQGKSSMKLYYTSTELPKGRMLLMIKPAGTIVKR